jgi:Zn-dependent M28 family amino/carboxypeptidase
VAAGHHNHKERPDVSSTLLAWATFSVLVLSVAVSRAAGPETAIDGQAILGHIRVLASDEFEGRLPGTPGEDKTVAYLIDQFQRMGLEPGNPNGTFVQEVPLIGYRTKSTGAIHAGNTTIDLATADDWVAVSRRQVPEAAVKGSDLVFVGYGVVAPEFGWDDYKGQDVRGKTLVMLVGDPPVPDPADPSKLDPKVFGGPAMTYYGRWTYKYEIAAEKGAAAVLLIHETGPAGYPYEVVKGSWGRENFDIPADDGNAGRAAVEAWIALGTARKLFEATGQDFDALKQAAVNRDFRPVPLAATLDATIHREQREVKSRNVVAKCPGSDPTLRGEFIVYTAHWDHLGRDASLSGDQIYNGAADNASGTAMLLELARAFAASKPRPKRSILFLAVTAEEQGLLGAKSYAEHPLYPLEKTLANINMDVINLWGRTSDMTSVGLGQSTLDDLLAEVAQERGRAVGPDPEPEKGLYYRSDHFEFAKVGVPALNAKGGMTYIGRPADYGRIKRDEYTKNDYHKPSDEVKPDWDLSGAAEDASVLYEVGLRVANGDRHPEWKPTSEFRARREAMLKAAGR